MAHAINFENVEYSYGNDRPNVLDGLSFHVEQGEIVALVGDNGSGKSTVAKLCCAHIVPTNGNVEIFGQNVASLDMRGKIKLRQRVQASFQNPDDQFVSSHVLDEVAFGPCNLGCDRNEIILRAEEALGTLGLLEMLGRNVTTLSGGQKQKLSIADGLAMLPEILILDEPTSMLDEDGKSQIKLAIKKLRDSGITVLLITHNMHDASVADKVIELSGGKCSDANTEKCFNKETSNAFSPEKEKEATHVNSSKDPVISFKDVSFKYEETENVSKAFGKEVSSREILNNFSLDIFQGETLAIMGDNGTGKTTLLQLMNGLLRPTSGTVCVNGVATSSKHGANSARKNVGLCFQFPEKSSFCQSVYDEVAFGPKNLNFSLEEVDVRVKHALRALGLDFEQFAKRNPAHLSGGEARRVSIASTLSMDTPILALDEPFAGLDAYTHNLLMQTLKKLKEAGKTIVIVTHDIADANSLADRVFHLEEPGPSN